MVLSFLKYTRKSRDFDGHGHDQILSDQLTIVHLNVNACLLLIVKRFISALHEGVDIPGVGEFQCKRYF